VIRAALITVSTKGAAGEREDESGPAMREALAAAGIGVIEMALVPDGIAPVQTAIRSAIEHGANLVLTSGGTGLSPNDLTPDATRGILDREVTGIAEALRRRSLEQTPHGMLSRGLAGSVGATLIVNLPGSPRACRESLDVLIPVLPHAIEAARRGDRRGWPRDRTPLVLIR